MVSKNLEDLNVVVVSFYHSVAKYLDADNTAQDIMSYVLSDPEFLNDLRGISDYFYNEDGTVNQDKLINALLFTNVALDMGESLGANVAALDYAQIYINNEIIKLAITRSLELWNEGKPDDAISMMFTALGGSIGVVAQFLPSRAEQMVSFLASGMSVAGYIAENGYDWLQPMLFAKDINDEAVDQLLQNISLSNPDMIGTFETFDGWVATYGVPQVLAWMKSALESKHLAVEDLSSYAADGYDSLLMEIVASVKNKTVGMVVLPSHQETMKLLADSATRPAAIAALENLIPFGIAGYQVQKKEYGDSKWLEARSLFTQLHLSQYTVLGDPNGVSGMDPHTLEELRVALQTFMLREGIDGGRVEFEDAAILDENIFMQLGNDHTGVSKIVFGGDAADGAVGGAKKDLLFTGAGNDTLNGGEGNDYLDGGSGSDTYLINGEDVVADADMQGKIIFANNNLQAAAFVSDGSDSGVWYGTQKEQGSDASSLIARRSDSDLIVAHINGTDTALIKDFFVRARENGSGGLAALGIELDVAAQGAQTAVRYASGVLNRYNLIYASAPLYTQVRGGDLDDLLMANGSGGVHASLGSGNDRVFGSYLADYIDGGDGNDILNGSQFIPAGSNKPKEEMALDTDIIIGGGGRDLINGMAGNDIIHTGLKNEHTYTVGRNERGDWALGAQGNDSIFGSTERDLLMGGADSDTIHGGAGDDVILGDGGIRFGTRSLSQTGTPPDVEVRYNRLGLGQWQPAVTQIPGTAVAVEHTVMTDEANPQTKALYAFQSTHPDNDRWTLEINRETSDYALVSTVPLNENDHRVAAGGGGDFLYGGYGNDLMIGQDGSDYLYGGAGDDILYGDDNREDIENYGNDFLNGGEGSDRLYGGRGYDTYWFRRTDLQNAADTKVVYDSDGQGRIVIDATGLDQYGWVAVGGEEGVANQWQAPGTGLQLTLAGNELSLAIEGSAAKIRIQNYNAADFGLQLPTAFVTQEEPLPPETSDTPVAPNEPAAPDSPAVPDQPATEQITNKAPVATGLFAAQKLTAGEEWRYTLPDNRFNDPNGDRLAYSVSLADGSPLPDWLRFDPSGLTLSGTPAAATGLQLKVSVSDGRGGSADSPLQLNIVPAGRYQRPDSTLSGTDTGETLHGSDSREDLNGYGGNDLIYGYGGNDVINGGTGNDYLEGGDGADTYVFSEEWGQDTVAAVNGEDHMYFKDTVLSQVSFSREGADLLMNKTGTSDQIRMVNQFGSASGNGAFGIVNWEFADGQILKAADVYAITEMGDAATQANNLINAMAAFGDHAAASDAGIVAAENRANILLAATAA